MASAACCCLAAFAMLSCASIRPADVRQESGFYYGIGSGASVPEAADAAKRDLISNALTESARRGGSRKARVEISVEAAKAFELPKLRPVAQDKTEGSATIVYRIKATEWDKRERAREDAIRTEIMQSFAALKTAPGLPLAERVMRAGGLLDRLSEEGLADLLTESSESSSLVFSSIESFCRRVAAGISIQAIPEGGFIDRDPSITVKVQTSRR